MPIELLAAVINSIFILFAIFVNNELHVNLFYDFMIL